MEKNLIKSRGTSPKSGLLDTLSWTEQKYTQVLKQMPTPLKVMLNGKTSFN